MMNKKAVNAPIWYWFFYIPITIIIFVALAYYPGKVLTSSLQPIQLDAQISNENIKQKITAYSPVLGSRQRELAGPITETAKLRLSDKKYVYQVTADGQTYYSSKELYEDRAPLAPVKYTIHTTKNPFTYNNQPITVTINQVYPKQYA